MDLQASPLCHWQKVVRRRFSPRLWLRRHGRRRPSARTRSSYGQATRRRCNGDAWSSRRLPPRGRRRPAAASSPVAGVLSSGRRGGARRRGSPRGIRCPNGGLAERCSIDLRSRDDDAVGSSRRRPSASRDRQGVVARCRLLVRARWRLCLSTPSLGSRERLGSHVPTP